MAGRPTPRNLFSFSRVKTLDQCPFRYRMRYLKGLKEAFRSIETFLGNTLHETLEWLYRERGRGASPGLEATLDDLARRWHEGWTDDIAVVRVDDSPDAAYLLGREMTERFHRTVFVNDHSTTLALEQRVSMRLSERVVFTGFADRVGRTAGGRLFVVDYKSSRTEGDAAEFSEGLQAPLYAACAMDRHGDGEALAGYHYLRHGTTRWQTIGRERGRAVLARFLELAERALGTTEFPARPGVLCAWCGFNAICDAAQVPESLAGGLRRARELDRSLHREAR